MYRRNREREGNLKLECVEITTVEERILNWVSHYKGRDQEVVKRSGRDEPMWVAIHKCIEAT
jgi:hypothetical protein